MGRWVDAGAASELAEGTMRTVALDGPPLLVAHVGDSYYAAQGRCPHMGGRLAEGKLEGTVVTCPRHGSRFDLTDGRVLRWTEWSGLVLALAKVFKSPRPLETFATRVEEGRLMVELPSKDS
jgi:3-phenylpropionate/trans-cinnamate dioxygenase ferredoxin subunit